MTDFNDRIEGEIKTHEAEMLRKAVITKYGSKSLHERILYMMERYKQDQWNADAMFTKLNETGLAGTDTLQDVKNLFSNQANNYPGNVSA